MKEQTVTTAPATPESVWAILRETAQLQKQFAAEAEARFKKNEEAVLRSSQAAAARSKEIEEAAVKRSKEIEAAADKRLKKLEAKLNKIGKLVGGIGHNNGYFAEDYFFNALCASKRFAGSKYDYVSQNIHDRDGKVEDEFDIVMYNGTSVAIVETKYRVHPEFLQELTTKKVRNFRTLFPNYANHTLYLGIASMSFNDEVVTQAKELGVGLIRAQGDTIEYDTDHVKAY
jgi:hypothetical protein